MVGLVLIDVAALVVATRTATEHMDFPIDGPAIVAFLDGLFLNGAAGAIRLGLLLVAAYAY
jgi:hypothetical protein